MKNHLLAIGITAALSTIAFCGVANAKLGANGTSLNGTKLNGLTLQGTQLQSLKVEGGQLVAVQTLGVK